MSIAVMICYVRSGGTLLNRCLGSLPDVVMMSEVNPKSNDGKVEEKEYRTVKDQAKHWYDIDLKSEGYEENILELYDYCNKNNKKLIIRDFSFVDFNPCAFNSNVPVNKLYTLELLKDKVETEPFAFTRDSIDACVSWIPLRIKKTKSFFKLYRNYSEAVVDNGMPLFKYEDFCADPDKVMKEICESVNLNYSDEYKDYGSFYKVNGDINFTDKETKVRGGSRGIKQKSIRPLKRKRIPLKRAVQINNNKDMVCANKILGYPASYFSVELEKFNFKKFVDNFIKNFIS